VVKAGAAAERSEGSLDGREHSTTISLAGAAQLQRRQKRIHQPNSRCVFCLDGGGTLQLMKKSIFERR
jgi:hypothetical protein